MPKITYEHGLPPVDVFQKTLTEALAQTHPVDDLIAFANELWTFEQRYHMSSADFYKNYQVGSLNDELQHCIEWVATYEFFLKTKHLIEAALLRTAVQPERYEPAA